jgi:hypothetical protein
MILPSPDFQPKEGIIMLDENEEKEVQDEDEDIVVPWYAYVLNDKGMVIIAVTLIAFAVLYVLKGEGKEIIQSIITGLFGVAVGRMSKSTPHRRESNKPFMLGRNNKE